MSEMSGTMTKLTRITSVILTIVMLFGIVTVAPFSVGAFEEEGVV